MIRLGTVGWFPEACPKEGGFVYQISSTSVWALDGRRPLCDLPAWCLGLLAAAEQALTHQLTWWLGPLRPQPTVNFQATCSQVCSSLCYRSYRLNYRLQEWGCTEEAAGKLCLWGKCLSRFTLGLLKALSFFFIPEYSKYLLVDFFNYRAKHCGK